MKRCKQSNKKKNKQKLQNKELTKRSIQNQVKNKNKAKQHQSCKYRNFVHPDNSNSSIFVDFCERVIKSKEKTIETKQKVVLFPRDVPYFMKQIKNLTHSQSVSVARDACDELLKNKQKK